MAGRNGTYVPTPCVKRAGAKRMDNDNTPTEFPGLKDDSAPDVAAPKDGKATPSPTPPETGKPEGRPVSRLAAIVEERPPTPLYIPERKLKAISRRDFLLYGAGAVAAASALWWLLPEDTQGHILSPAQKARLDSMQARAGLTTARKDNILGRALTFDDDVAEALYSKNRGVPTYTKAQVTPNLRNNYDGPTPEPDYLDDWKLTVAGLASGRVEHLTLANVVDRMAHQDEITRLVCVEGWSAIAWWGGVRFADFLKTFPPAPEMKWASLYSSVNLGTGDDGNSIPDPYYVSIDLDTARHAQTLLATHQNGVPLSVEHGAPLRLVAPMKLGLKNIKAITKISYTTREPADYWRERGYSKYDGL